MRRSLALAILVAMAVLVLPAAADDLAEILDSAEIYGDQVVEIKGEFIGDYSPRAEGVWVQLNSDSYVDAPFLDGRQLAGTNLGIGALIPSEIFDEGWGEPGGYRRRGPVVVVTAVFKYHDPVFQGETYLEVTAVELVEPAKPLSEPHRRPLALVGIATLLLAAFIHFGTDGVRRLQKRLG